jgi:hypothetical protein
MVNSKQYPDEVTVEQKMKGIGKNTNGTDKGVLHSCVDNGAWLEMENNTDDRGNNQKIRKQPSVLLNITHEEFQANETMSRAAKKHNQNKKMTDYQKRAEG